MNARFNTNTPEEAAKIIGVSTVAVTNWCRDRKINCNNVSDGTNKGRYEIEDDEVRYVRYLVDKYGSRNALLYYRKDWKANDMNYASKNKIEYDKEYSSKEAADYIGVDKTTVNAWCRDNKINFNRVEKVSGRGNKYSNCIPGWELLYIKELYETYGCEKGRYGSPMNHYIKNKGERGMNNEIESEVYELDEPVVCQQNVNEESEGVIEYKKIETDDDILLNAIIRIREIKAQLKSLTEEYAELKEKIISQL